MQSTAKTVEEYLQELPGDRKIAMAKLRKPFLQIFPLDSPKVWNMS